MKPSFLFIIVKFLNLVPYIHFHQKKYLYKTIIFLNFALIPTYRKHTSKEEEEEEEEDEVEDCGNTGPTDNTCSAVDYQRWNMDMTDNGFLILVTETTDASSNIFDDDTI